MQRIRSYALVAVPLLFASAACTALLGDFDVTSGAAANDGGDIPYEQTLASVGKTLGKAVGVAQADLDAQITMGKVVTAALA